MSLATNNEASIPSHVPPELVMPYPLTLGATSYEDPFKTIIPEMHRGPAVIYSPNAWQGVENAWVFRKEAHLRAIFMDTEHFSSADFSPFAKLIGDTWSVVPVEVDPPHHREYRNILAPLFTPRKVLELDQQVKDIARDYIDEFKDKGHCELMADFACRFPIAVFLQLFGLPLDDVDQFMAWENDLLHTPDLTAIATAVSAVKHCLMTTMDERRLEPKDDLLSYITNYRINGRPLNDDERMGIAFNLYIGGLDTVTTNIGWQFRHLAQDIALQEKLRSNPELIPVAVEEMLRAYSAVAISRTCVKKTELGGVTLMPGDRVMMSTSLGSNDPETFDNPTVVDIDRNHRHLGFGTGIHSCVGARLARRELHVAIETFLALIPTFRQAEGTKILTHLGTVMQQDCLPLVWAS